ncbi:MAG: hypothetical protein P8Y99_08810 [Calditrichaceae bacterium]
MNQSADNSTNVINPIKRITALWALSEAALGGVLHAFRIPFTGLFIGSSAVIFITLISFFNDKRGTILKATLLVIMVKAIVSPYSPINAYFAVAFQGIIGEILFLIMPSKRMATFLLGFLSLLESSVQKILVITIVFGQNVWKAIDLFSEYVVNQFLIRSDSADLTSLSVILISIYISIHLSAGIIIGIWAPQLAANVKNRIQGQDQIAWAGSSPVKDSVKKSRKRRKIWKKFSIIAIILLATIIFILSYFFPVFEKSTGYAALLMIFRSIMIIGIWYYLIGPLLLEFFRRFLDKKKSVYKNEINEIINIFPLLKQVIVHTWTELNTIKPIKRIPRFIESLLIFLLLLEFKTDRKSE